MSVHDAMKCLSVESSSSFSTHHTTPQ